MKKEEEVEYLKYSGDGMTRENGFEKQNKCKKRGIIRCLKLYLKRKKTKLTRNIRTNVFE